MNQNAQSKEQGATLVEFALILPILILFVFAIVDFGRYFFIQHTLQYATREGMRLALVGGTITREEELLDRTDSMRTIIREKVSLAINPDDLQINVFEVNPDFSDPDSWDETSDAGGPDAIMRVRTRYNLNFITPIIGSFFSENSILVQVQGTYRNEFFDTN